MNLTSNTRLQKATLISSEIISKNVKSLTFQLEHPQTFVPGQFYIVRHILKDKSIFEREYSIANKLMDTHVVELGIQKISQGVVSEYLHSLKKGDKVLLRGPLGKYFNFYEDTKEMTYIAGGAGIIPFMSMIRSYPKKNFQLIASFKSLGNVPYLDELRTYKNLSLLMTLTRKSPKNWTGYRGRIKKELLTNISNQSLVYICGRTSFVEDIYLLLKETGIKEEMIRRERFG